MRIYRKFLPLLDLASLFIMAFVIASESNESERKGNATRMLNESIPHRLIAEYTGLAIVSGMFSVSQWD